MNYRTSFNGLQVEVKGVYSAYNLTSEEIEDIRKRFNNQINGSNSNYTIYFSAERHVWLKLFVHTVWIPIRFDIRKDLLELTHSDKIYEKDVLRISKELKDMRIELHVSYNAIKNSWILEDREFLIETLKDIL